MIYWESDKMIYKGVLHFLNNVSSQQVMINFLKRLDNKAMSSLFELLNYTNNEVEQRWIDAYNVVDRQITE